MLVRAVANEKSIAYILAVFVRLGNAFGDFRARIVVMRFFEIIAYRYVYIDDRNIGGEIPSVVVTRVEVQYEYQIGFGRYFEHLVGVEKGIYRNIIRRAAVYSEPTADKRRYELEKRVVDSRR